MPIANTVEATIVVNFEDRLTGPSQKAFEQFRKFAESTFQAVCVSGVAAFEKLRAAQEAAFSVSQNSLADFSNRLFEILKGPLALLTLIALPLENIRRNFNLLGKALRPLLQALSNLRLALPLIGAGFLAFAANLAPVAIFLAEVTLAVGLLFLVWKGLQAINELALEVQLKDEASAKANLLRKSMESTFSDPIVQEIQVLQRNLSGPLGPLSGTGNPVLDDGLITLRRTAPSPGLNLEPQFNFPSFASGIRFVPRDMLANIHKGETVLPRSQAEQFRNGQMRSISVGNITLNMNGGASANRNEARRFARMIREELQRTDERTTF